MYTQTNECLLQYTNILDGVLPLQNLPRMGIMNEAIFCGPLLPGSFSPAPDPNQQARQCQKNYKLLKGLSVASDSSSEEHL